MSERDQIFARIREALSIPAPKPGAHHDREASRPCDVRQVLPATGTSFDQNADLFRKNAIDLKADFHLVNSLEELVDGLVRLRDAGGWKKIATHKGSLTDPACAALDLPFLFSHRGYDVTEMEQCDAGISECDALVAQTGSVVLTSRSSGGRALSVLPPHHVVLARRDQMVSGLPEAFALLKSKYGSSYPSMISLITGPSRTGDIERILVLGAHGPKKLTIFCL